ncbi:DNA-directed RNA polymerase V subunit 7-like [Phalaenopsis equestris]|uniref:DNA-directed RNA polymerase V subunit 7-like n=1 Tax=Phalaenopsis equestris TaxID=78828 RepID=UPI0009E22138|nr:DNA-directed RNA polymerase V subunit 7-like [Phalaenopsis equestris]
MVFLELEMKGKVPFHPDQLDSRGCLLPSKAANLHLLAGLIGKKASKKHGYYVAATIHDSTDEGEAGELNGEAIIFTVSFSCTAVKPRKGEILIGFVDRVVKHGIFLKVEPIESIFLPEKMMEDYKFVMEEEGMFVNECLESIMVKGTKVRFRVDAIRWIEWDREFHVMATIRGDFLGPISI